VKLYELEMVVVDGLIYGDVIDEERGSPIQVVVVVEGEKMTLVVVDRS